MPVVVLLGPSGAGKTCLAEALQEHGWLWIEADQFHEDGIKRARLVQPWNAFYEEGDPAPLRNALRRRAKAERCSGAVLSVTSIVTPKEEQMQRAAECGLHVIVLFGLREACLAAFLQREQLLNRGLDETHWRRYNEPYFPDFEAPNIERFRLATFTTEGLRRSKEELVASVLARTQPPDD